MDWSLFNQWEKDVAPYGDYGVGSVAWLPSPPGWSWTTSVKAWFLESELVHNAAGLWPDLTIPGRLWSVLDAKYKKMAIAPPRYTQRIAWNQVSWPHAGIRPIFRLWRLLVLGRTCRPLCSHSPLEALTATAIGHHGLSPSKAEMSLSGGETPGAFGFLGFFRGFSL